jgi:AcrR family transcriptional regulator
MMPRRSQVAVSGTRAAVAEAAVRRASVEGLGGLTIGRLASVMKMSKSGLFGLFGDKQRLQLATLNAGIEFFTREVWSPVAEVEPGRARLLALCDSWLSFFEREVLPGGCFMTTVLVEFDARPGAVREAVSEAMDRWLAALEREIETAVNAGELPADTDPAEAAFQLNALASAASCNYQLSGSRAVFDRARRAMERVLARP